MPEDKRRLRYGIVGKNWAEGWFLLALLAGLFFGVQGLIGVITAYMALRAIGSKLPAALAAVAALGIGVLTFVVCWLAFGHR